MPLVSPALLMPAVVKPDSGNTAGANLPANAGNTSGANSIFGSLFKSYSEMLPPVPPQTGHEEAATKSEIPIAPETATKPEITTKLGITTKFETTKKPAKHDAQSPAQAPQVTSGGPAIAAAPMAAGNGASPVPAQALMLQSPQAAPIQDPTTPNRISPSANLAFAVRLTPANMSPAPVQMQRENNQAAVTPDESGPGIRSVSSPAGMPVVNAIQQRDPGTSSNKDAEEFGSGEQQQPLMPAQSHAAADASAPPAHTDFDAELKNATAPPRQAHIQIVGSENQRVDIRLLEHGGALAVSVRTSDTALTRTLQDHIPELTSRLDSEHLHSEAWTPTASGSGAMRDSGSNNSFSGQSNSSSGQNNSGGGQRQQRDGEQPKWLQELENNKEQASIKEIFYVSSE